MQSKMLNIPSYIEDPSYRYKMPAQQLKVEGRGNGIKTKIVNLTEIATALRVPPTYALKFLGHELGSQTNESQGVINGSFNEPEMRKHMDKFIEKYVLCPSCKYPEMVLKIKHGAIGGACNSCGNRCVLDNTHKIAAYILKNPPKNSSEFKGDKGDKDKKEKDDGKKGKGEKEDKKSKHADKDKEHHDKEKKEDKKHEEEKTNKAEKGEKVEKIKDAPVQIVTFKDLEEDFVQKVRQVYQQYAGGVENFDDKPEEVKKIVQKAREIVTEEHLNKLPYIVFNSIFDVNIVKEIGKNKAILLEAYEQAKTRDTELDTLLSLQKLLLIRLATSKFDKFIPTIVKLFYDEDLLEEDFLLDWDSGKLNSKLIMDWRFQSGINERFKVLAKPIIKWLKEEEDDGEGAAEEEEEDVLAKKNDEGEGSDIDIDDI